MRNPAFTYPEHPRISPRALNLWADSLAEAFDLGGTSDGRRREGCDATRLLRLQVAMGQASDCFVRDVDEDAYRVTVVVPVLGVDVEFVGRAA